MFIKRKKKKTIKADPQSDGIMVTTQAQFDGIDLYVHKVESLRSYCHKNKAWSKVDCEALGMGQDGKGRRGINDKCHLK